MRLLLVLLLIPPAPSAAERPGLLAPDTLRVEVGSPAVSGRTFIPHAARVRVRIGDGEGDGRLTAEWTKELILGDSAGRPVMRWVTRGTQFAPGTPPVTWELSQTSDAETLAPRAISSHSSTGAAMRLTIEGRRVRGTRQAAGRAPVQRVDLTLTQAGFIATASDLVPLAAGLREGVVMIAPRWGPSLPDSELRIFSVLGRATIAVEGAPIEAWKVEERRHRDRALLATWYLITESPYMVYGEILLPDGRIQRMTAVAIPPGGR